MSNSVRILPETLRTFNSAGLTGTYQAFGIPLVHRVAVIKVKNNSNALITFSWDGINDHDTYPGGTYDVIDVTANRGHDSQGGFYIEEGTQFYVKGAAGTGFIYLIVYYPVYNAP